MTTLDQPPPTKPSDAEIAQALRQKALEGAQAAIREHLRRAAELRQSALEGARGLLGGDESTSALLAHLERSLQAPVAPGLQELAESLAPPSDPLSAVPRLLEERQRVLDDTLRRLTSPRTAEPPADGPASGSS